MISYAPLWKTLKKKNMNIRDLRKVADIATATAAKLKRNESLTLTMIDKICRGLNCNISDVVEFINDDIKVFIPTKGDMVKVDYGGRHRYGKVIEVISSAEAPTFYILQGYKRTNSQCFVSNIGDEKFAVSEKDIIGMA